MAAINFPNSPAVNDIHTENDSSWQWNGTSWIFLGTGGTGVSSDTIWDAKGDLVVGTGANTAIRLAVSSTNGHVLSSDSSTTTGLKWINPAELYSLFHTWLVGSWTADSTQTAPQPYGTAAATTAGTPTVTAPASSRVRNISYVSAATTNSDAGVSSNTHNGYLSHDWRILVWAGLDTLTNVRYTVGAVDSISNMVSYDDGFNGEGAWFRYSTNASDTNWMCITTNDTAGGPTITDTGVAVTTGTKKFEIHKTTSEVKFFLDNVLVATHTTNLPDNDTTLNLCAGRAKTLANAAATVHFVQCLFLTKLPS
jgi:hypothetical protein